MKQRTRRCPLLVALLAILALGSRAQVVNGDVAVVNLLSPTLKVLHANGTTTAYNLGSLGGSNQPTCIALDPNVANSVVIGGNGFFGRATITGAATATWTPITAAAGWASAATWDGLGFVTADYNGLQVERVRTSPVSVTALTSGSQPWGFSLNSSAIDTKTGRLFVAGGTTVWVLAPGSNAATVFANSPGGSVNALRMDDRTGDPVAVISGINRVVRITPAGGLIDLSSPGSVVGPTSIDVDANGDFVVGGSFGMVYRVPRAGGSSTLIGTATGVTGAINGVAVFRPRLGQYLTPLGGGGAVLSISGIPAGTTEGWTVPSLNVSLPAGTGPTLGMNPDSLTFAILQANQAPSAGGPFHWLWPTAPSVYPAVPLILPPGTFPPGFAVDLIAIAVQGPSYLASGIRRSQF